MINPSIFKSLPYDTIGDFSPVAVVGAIPMVLVALPHLGAKNVAELIALAKTRPGQLNYGSLGIGTVLHLAGELFASEAGIDIKHVPYKDSGGVTTDLSSGQIELAFLGLPTVAGLVKSGRIKALAVTTPQRSSALSNVPSLSDALPRYSLDAWIGLIGPKGLPQDTLQKYFDALKAAMEDGAFKEAIASQGLTPALMGPAEARSYFIEDMRKSAELVRRSGATPQ